MASGVMVKVPLPVLLIELGTISALVTILGLSEETALTDKASLGELLSTAVKLTTSEVFSFIFWLAMGVGVIVGVL